MRNAFMESFFCRPAFSRARAARSSSMPTATVR